VYGHTLQQEGAHIEYRSVPVAQKTQKIFMGRGYSVASGGYLYLVWAVC